MTTLIRFTTLAGTQRCDARCYNATGPDCSCPCGGMNHGKGLEEATGLTKNKAEELLATNTEQTKIELFPVHEYIGKGNGKARKIRDKETGIEYPSKYAAGKALSYLINASAVDRWVWYKIQRAFPERFEEIIE